MTALALDDAAVIKCKWRPRAGVVACFTITREMLGVYLPQLMIAHKEEICGRLVGWLQ